MKTTNDDGDTVNFAARTGDAHRIEFRKPSGNIAERPAAYDPGTGTLAFDQGAAHDDLLDEAGEWLYRGALARSDGTLIRSSWSGRFWVIT